MQSICTSLSSPLYAGTVPDISVYIDLLASRASPLAFFGLALLPIVALYLYRALFRTAGAIINRP
ncbi:hypothetical protein KCP77_11705 [Salmonella enterica subsp. enterica]|nr:hypothetical protein KCP77_11705 [Salmonella enterica subsp. enterica]